MKFLIASLMFVNVLFAQTLSVGDSYPVFAVTDQFGDTGRVAYRDELVILTFEKGVSADLNTYLKAKKSDYLPTNKVKYIADISGMPTFVTNMFALPKMKKYKYNIYLIHEEEEGEPFVRKDDMVTVFKLKNYKIESIDYMTPKEVIDLIDR